MVHEAVSVEEMRSHLLTLDQVRARFAETEPLGEVTFESGTAGIRYEPDWAGTELTDYTGAYLQVPGGEEYQLTKQGALQIGAQVGIPRKIQEDTAPDVLSPFVNWRIHERLGNKELKALTREGRVQAITRATVSPFSNLRMLDVMLGGIENKYGEGEVLADYKFAHDLEHTGLRLIIPAFRRTITGTSVADDTWSVGIDFSNSLVGLRQLNLQGYMFRWWCTNGATDIHHATGAFSRRGSTEEDALAWAAQTVDEVLGGLEPALDNVQLLTGEAVAGDVRDVLEGLFRDYGIPSRDRSRVIAAMAEDDEMTAYSLMNAITQAANLDGLDDRSRQRLMALGGHVAGSHGERCSLGKLHRVAAA